MILGVSFKYSTDYDYDTHTDCYSHGCHDEGICRCETISNAHVTSVNIPLIVNEIYNSINDNSLSSKRNMTINSILGGVSKEIDFYTIDRILRINKVYEPSNWEVGVCNGYYGQEIDEVTLDSSVATKIEDEINEALLIIDINKRVEFLLKLEYGHILPDLNDRQYSVETIERDSVIFGSDEHYRKVNTKNLEHYSDKNYDGIRGVALVKKDGYRLIDGYHRCSTSESRYIKILIAK